MPRANLVYSPGYSLHPGVPGTPSGPGKISGILPQKSAASMRHSSLRVGWLGNRGPWAPMASCGGVAAASSAIPRSTGAPWPPGPLPPPQPPFNCLPRVRGSVFFRVAGAKRETTFKKMPGLFPGVPGAGANFLKACFSLLRPPPAVSPGTAKIDRSRSGLRPQAAAELRLATPTLFAAEYSRVQVLAAGAGSSAPGAQAPGPSMPVSNAMPIEGNDPPSMFRAQRPGPDGPLSMKTGPLSIKIDTAQKERARRSMSPGPCSVSGRY